MSSGEFKNGIQQSLPISPLNYHSRPPLYCNQSGQATVFVLAFLGVIVLSAVFLFKSGQLTTEKMQLQNGADSAAYTASMLEARAMNFTAYTNRAMVANEVAIGQMVGLLSWADELVAIGETFEVLGDFLDGTLVLAEAGAALNTIGGGFITTGKTMKTGLLVVAPLYTRAISMLNMVYSVSQEIYHLTTIVLVTNAIVKSLEDNVPGTPGDLFVKRLLPPYEKKGAQLSPIGVIALAGHLVSYANGFSTRYALKGSTSSAENRLGMGRLAATVRAGRDPFSSGDPKDGQDRGWTLMGRATAGIGLSKYLTLTGTFTYGIDSVGGSEIRYKKDKNSFIWSAVDTAAWKDYIDLNYHYFGHKHHKRIRLPNLPLAGGAYQASGSKQSLNATDMPQSLKQYGTPPAYGGAADNTGWFEAGIRIAKNKVTGDPYANLRGYRDIDPEKPEGSKILPFTSPFFLVGAIRPVKDIEGQGPQFSAPLDLPSTTKAFGLLGAFAKAEVYHCRPDDLSYFKRAKDNKGEKDNLFSPFWQARLVKTKNLDRLLGLALQQDVIWLSSQDAKNIPGMSTVTSKLSKWLNSLIPLLGEFL